MNKTAVILLAWKRPRSTLKLIRDLFKQTRTDFDIYVSNSNPENIKLYRSYEKTLKSSRITFFYNDSNQYYSFRRFFVARDLAKKGYDKILLLDDDLSIENTYIERALSQFQEKTYFSGHAFKYPRKEGPYDYYKDREQVLNVEDSVDYAGPGFSMMDSSLFLEDKLFDVLNSDCYVTDDIWLSYVCGHLLDDWKIKYMDVSIISHEGVDEYALHKNFGNKSDLFNKLINLGWLKN